MFAHENFSIALQSHPGSLAVEPACEMYDIHDSPAWKAAYSENGVLMVIIVAFHLHYVLMELIHSHVKYSMWPIILTVLNLPRNMRNLCSCVLLLGIIPGNGN